MELLTRQLCGCFAFLLILNYASVFFFCFPPNCFGCCCLLPLRSPPVASSPPCISCWPVAAALVPDRWALRSEAEVQSHQWGARPCPQRHDLFVTCPCVGTRGNSPSLCFLKLFLPVIPVTPVPLPSLWELSSIKHDTSTFHLAGFTSVKISSNSLVMTPKTHSAPQVGLGRTRSGWGSTWLWQTIELWCSFSQWKALSAFSVYWCSTSLVKNLPVQGEPSRMWPINDTMTH